MEQPFEGSNCRLFAGGIERFAQEQEARGMIGDGQRIAVAAITELELSLEVGAPQIIGDGAPRQRRAARAVARRPRSAPAEQLRLIQPSGWNLTLGARV